MRDVGRPIAGIGTEGQPYGAADGRQVACQVSGSQSGQHGTSPESMPTPGSSSARIRIMLLAANPLDTERLAVDEEARAIDQKIRLSRDRDAFDLITCWAVRPADLLEYLNRHRPHVVHFSGHGARSGEIVLCASDGTGQPVDLEALAEVFRIMRDHIRVVLLNACYTATQAQAINQHIDFVVGTRAPIADEAATVFAAAFYSALGFGRTVPEAFAQARAAMMVHGLPGHDVPQLIARPTADPHLRPQNQQMNEPTTPRAQNLPDPPEHAGKFRVELNNNTGVQVGYHNQQTININPR